jgi:hypothetical protein
MSRDSIGVAYAPSVLTLVSLIPLKCPRSDSLTFDTPLTILASLMAGEFARGDWLGDITGRTPEFWDIRDTALVSEV